MSTLAVITPSYSGDAELFDDLHQSVLAYTGPTTVHHVIVPPADKELFGRYAGDRCRIWTEPELLPGRFLRTPRRGVWLNPRRFWPPVRGWVLQQALKISAAAVVDADVVLIADSDVLLVRPTDAERFMAGKRLRLYRAEDAVHAGMTRHVTWHRAARRLLGLPPTPGLPLHDYVSSLNVWDPAAVRALQRRITEVTGRHWLDVFAAQLHVSEFILYGVFVDELWSGGHRPPADTTFCLDYWDTVPMDLPQALDFGDRMPREAIGMMISAKSGTPREVRTAAARHAVSSDGPGAHVRAGEVRPVVGELP